MTISRTHPYASEEEVPEGKRLRMRDWLRSRIGNPRYPGLIWLDQENNIFRIPWKHAALHGWDQDSDGALFRDWSEHTGACVKNAHPKQLKATFRCALHSLPDVHEIREKAKKRGDDACRVYKIDTNPSSQTKRRLIRIRNHRDKEKRSVKKSNCGRRQSIDMESTMTSPSNWCPYVLGSPEGVSNFNLYHQSPPSCDSKLQYFYQSSQDMTHTLLPPPINRSNVTQFTPDPFHQEWASLPESGVPLSRIAPSQGYILPKTEQRSYYPAVDEGSFSPSSGYSPSHSSVAPSPINATQPYPMSPRDMVMPQEIPNYTIMCNSQDEEKLQSDQSPYSNSSALNGSYTCLSPNSTTQSCMDYTSSPTFYQTCVNGSDPINLSLRAYQSNGTTTHTIGSTMTEMFPFQQLVNVECADQIAQHEFIEESLKILDAESSVAEVTNASWNHISTSPSTLPSASTLLTPSHSPTEAKNSLRWISDASPQNTPPPMLQPAHFSSGNTEESIKCSSSRGPTITCALPTYDYPLNQYQTSISSHQDILSSSPTMAYGVYK